MNKSLTVTAFNYKPKTAAAQVFNTDNISEVAANGQSGNIPAISGNTEFIYLEADGTTNHYVVSDTLVDVQNAVNGYVGAVANGTVEEFYPAVRRTKITLTEWTQAVTNANLCVGRKIYDFPIGYIKVLSALINITVSSATVTATPEVGLGTVLGAGAQATIGAAGATMENICDGTAMSAIADDPATAYSNACVVEADASVLDGSTTAIDLYLNMAAAWGAADDIVVNGTVEIVWVPLGDK